MCSDGDFGTGTLNGDVGRAILLRDMVFVVQAEDFRLRIVVIRDVHLALAAKIEAEDVLAPVFGTVDSRFSHAGLI